MADRPRSRWGPGRVGIYALHWFIILNLVVEVFYATYMVFDVLRPPGVDGPLWGSAMKLVADNPDLMMARRAYATEAWIAIVGLSLYVGLTEILPRLQRYRAEDAARG